MIQRFSSRIHNLSESFFKDALKDAVAYDRIAGYFSSSIIEVAGESIESMKGKVRIVCNSQLQMDDVQFIKDQPQAMKLEWCDSKPEEVLSKIPDRLKRLYSFLTSGKMEVRVLPNDVFGLIHGKAGVITKDDGSKLAFMGSMNETYSGWSKNGNYEIAWIDNDEEAIQWTQNEFNTLWQHPLSRPLIQFVIDDIKRISERKVIYEIKEWRDSNNPASTVIESPVYRKEFGLWEHQKYFVDLAYRSHKKGSGARFVLADMVGLGKTIQLALSALLMALEGDKPILVIAPKTLIWQWQDELKYLLDMPSAVWNGKFWTDENKLEYPPKDEFSLSKCPRRVGIISQGMIINSKSKSSELLLKQSYECIIVDESHRARRKNFGKGKENDRPIPNNLMEFLIQISKKTKSMLLATATPVQIHPIEAWDLLYILSSGNESVLGNAFSNWQLYPSTGIDLITDKEELTSNNDKWSWLRNPFPPTEENPSTFGVFRRLMNLSNDKFSIQETDYFNFSKQEQSILNKIFADDFLKNNNPFIRHIIRRERKYLETTINPETNQSFLKPIHVVLYGEGEKEGLQLSTHLFDAYSLAEEFSLLLSKRIQASGFIKTLLLRRVCSSMYAGLCTGQKLLFNWSNDSEEEDDSTEEEKEEDKVHFQDSPFKSLTIEELDCLKRFVQILEEHQDKDPKYDLVKQILVDKKIVQPWIERGCIVFSQYFDTIKWFCDKFAKDFPNISFGLYAGGDKSAIYENGIYHRKSKDEIKRLVRTKQLKLLFGTDSASEGLNLQSLGTLINLDLPWNPTRLEQRKGRIQRIGQERDEIFIYNMRYKDSVEDRVHQLLADRLKNIQDLFGQIPDTLEDVWVEIALNQIEEAQKHITAFSENDIHPFYNKYQNQQNIKPIHWESCTEVLDKYIIQEVLSAGW